MKVFLKAIFKSIGFEIKKIDHKKPKIAQPKEQISHHEFCNGQIDAPFDKVPFAGETLQYFVKNFEFDTVLDIGSGEGKHSDVLKESGKKVTSIDFGKSVYFEKRDELHDCIFGDYYTYEFETKFDAIWASHVLEHQPNPNLFLSKIHRDLKENGVLAITVPPLKNEIVGGHVTLWNAGLLLYQLVMAGFNCRNASIKSYGYNVSVVITKQSITVYPDLSYDNGDINLLKHFLPQSLSEPFDGKIQILNWND
jgi:SAM-dependent methyltransferase